MFFGYVQILSPPIFQLHLVQWRRICEIGFLHCGWIPCALHLGSFAGLSNLLLLLFRDFDLECTKVLLETLEVRCAGNLTQVSTRIFGDYLSTLTGKKSSPWARIHASVS